VVRAEDRAGNSTSVTRTITVDRTAPTVAIGEPGAAVNPDATMRVYATWGEPAAFLEMADEIVFPFPCADARHVLADALEDGDYYWQVRGYGITYLPGVVSFAQPGPWSEIGYFGVGDEEPFVPGDGGVPKVPGVPSAPSAPQPVIDEGVSPTNGGADDGPAVRDGDEPGDPSDAPGDAGGTLDEPIISADNAFPFVWLIIGVAVLVAAAAALAFIRFLARRS